MEHKKFFLTGLLPLLGMIMISLTTSIRHQKNDESGEKLARKYCSSCHMFPSPSLLDKKTWKESVLPNMGLRLGMGKSGIDPYADMPAEEVSLLKTMNVYPENPIVSKSEWQLIVNYYVTKAPEQPMVLANTLLPSADTNRFKAVPLFIGEQEDDKKHKGSGITMLRYDSSHQRLFVGNSKNQVFVLDKSFEVEDYWEIVNPAVDMQFFGEAPPKVLTIGSIAPSDQQKGFLFPLDSQFLARKASGIISSLARPVQFTKGDINKDGVEDLVVAEFGNHTGRLSFFESMDPQKKRVLKYQAGIRKVIVRDMNKDGLEDLLVLTAQAYEGVILMLNKGGGQFEEKTLLQFPPVYGVSHLELQDFNKDGHPDLLLSNGDNWDLSAIRKAYHGVRIYLNDGSNNFKEVFFQNIYGAAKAMANDFDGDGDLDIAVISFYDNPIDPSDGFVYLENIGGLRFRELEIAEAAMGKWLTMEVADLDLDGDKDIVLGSYFHNALEMTRLMSSGVFTFPQVLVIQNKTQEK